MITYYGKDGKNRVRKCDGCGEVDFSGEPGWVSYIRLSLCPSCAGAICNKVGVMGVNQIKQYLEAEYEIENKMIDLITEQTQNREYMLMNMEAMGGEVNGSGE